MHRCSEQTVSVRQTKQRCCMKVLIRSMQKTCFDRLEAAGKQKDNDHTELQARYGRFLTVKRGPPAVHHRAC